MTVLGDFLDQICLSHQVSADEIAIIKQLAEAAKSITEVIKHNGIQSDLGEDVGAENADGDVQKALDVLAEEIIIERLRKTSVAYVLSEEREEALPFRDADELFKVPISDIIVAIDPMDGSSNIDVNVTVGTIFSLMPMMGTEPKPCRGRDQHASGFFTYGPQTTLILGFARYENLCRFVLDPDRLEFVSIGGTVRIPEETNEYAINAAYAAHWHKPITAWMEKVLVGSEGGFAKNYRMRWVGSLVADAWRIFQRGGIFLYPADRRKGYELGRLRLVYEANPIALLAEKAGGMATDGKDRILDIEPQSLHQRVPLIFGAREEVMRIAENHAENR